MSRWLMALMLVCCGLKTVDEGSPSNDAGSRADPGLVAEAGTDASIVLDAGLWCAQPNAACLASGGDYTTPGHCCNGRMTCFRDAGISWCA